MTDDRDNTQTQSIEQEREAALAAMKRARRRAEKLARDTGTMLVQAVDGKPVRVPPPPAD
jgi:uncharacterized protein YggE